MKKKSIRQQGRKSPIISITLHPALVEWVKQTAEAEYSTFSGIINRCVATQMKRMGR